MIDNFEILRAGVRLLRKGIVHNDKREVVDRTENTLYRVIDKIERDFKRLEEDNKALLQWGTEAP